MKIVDIHVWKIDQAAVEGLDDIINANVVGADIRCGEPNIFYNIALKNDKNFTKEIYGSGKATNSSGVGRVRYSVNPEQHDIVIYNNGIRDDKCDGLCKTYSSNVQSAGGNGHDEAWAKEGFIYESFKPPSSTSGATRYAGQKNYPTNEDDYLIENTDNEDKCTREYNEFLNQRQKEVQATMITDFLILQTSSGDQSVMYFDKEAPDRARTESMIPQLEIEEEEMWDNNGNCAVDWEEDHINIGSYNGGYNKPARKFSWNSKGSQPVTYFDTHSEIGFGIVRPYRPSTNLMLYEGRLNIILQNKNKSYLTGKSEVFWSNRLHWVDSTSERFIGITDALSTAPYPTNIRRGNETDFNFGIKAPFRYPQDALEIGGYVVEAPYSKGHMKINDIVVHDPVSTENISLVSLTADRDQRTGDILGGAASFMDDLNNSKVCPGDPALCDFRVLNCTYFQDVVVADFDFNTVDSSGNPTNKVTKNSLLLPAGFSVESGLGLDGRALKAMGTRVAIPFSEMNLVYNRGLRLRVEADIIMDKPVSDDSMIFSFQKYGLYVPKGQQYAAFSTGNGVERRITRAIADGKRHKLVVEFSLSDVDRCKVWVDGVQGYSRVAKSEALAVNNIGNNLYIGCWGNDNSYPANFRLDNLKITRLAGTAEHNEDCYKVIMTHPSGLNAHQHTEECLGGKKVPKSGSQTFNYTGGVQTFTAPGTGIYTLEVWGAQGGGLKETGRVPYTGTVYGIGGKGGYSKGTINLSRGQTINIYVGGKGSGNSGGYNGGGSSAVAGAGGGGATDIRVGGTTYGNRVIVAGGGGGAQYGDGGAGGGTTGGNSATTVGGSGSPSIWGTLAQGGGQSTSTGSGQYGVGGNGSAGGDGLYGGAGGGGYVGGQGSKSDGSRVDDRGGAGGSGYIGGVSGGTTSVGIRSGHGQAKITWSNASEYENGVEWLIQEIEAGRLTEQKIKDILGDAYDLVMANSYGPVIHTWSGWTSNNNYGFSPTPNVAGNNFTVPVDFNAAGVMKIEVTLNNTGSSTSANLNWTRSGSSTEYTLASTMRANTNNQIVDFVVRNNSNWKDTISSLKFNFGNNVKIISIRVYGGGIKTSSGSSGGTGMVVWESGTPGSYTYNANAGTYKLEVWGAQGGNNGGIGGLGGYSTGNKILTGEQSLYIYVGKAGSPGVTSPTWGFNGGAKGYDGDSSSGGGATDIRTVNGSWDNVSSLNSRIIVAGGGGGGSKYQGNSSGGYGGGTVGGNFSGNAYSNYYDSGRGGNQSAGGGGSYNTGWMESIPTLGKGGVPGSGCTAGSGGGGGYYGGSHGIVQGGGGGSGYIGGVQSGQTIAGNASMPNPSGGTMTGKIGNGYARITSDFAPVKITSDGSDSVGSNGNRIFNATSSGRIGANIDKSSGDLGGSITMSGGMYIWTVPNTGNYVIQCIGASGGDASSSYKGGLGADITGTFSLTAGTKLNILVGQKGSDVCYASGGGASGVWVQNADTPMIIAGGGGGSNSVTNASSGKNASTSTSGVGSYGAGGTGGNGGGAGQTGVSGGAGWLSNGLGSSSTVTVPQALKNGGAGAIGHGSGGTYDGGFGGGGSGFGGGGGGGGYSGGGGGQYTSTSSPGGGGGSYNGGTNQYNSIAIQSGHGKIQISGVTSGGNSGGVLEGQVWNYDYTGGVQQTVLPAGEYKLEVWGAEGNTNTYTSAGGKGGYSKGEFKLSTESTIRVYVGGKSGYNGGGVGGKGANPGANGGGATDIRVDGTDNGNRVIVAGGGGGGGAHSNGGSSSNRSYDKGGCGGDAVGGGGAYGGSGSIYNGKGGTGTSTSSGGAGGVGGAASSNDRSDGIYYPAGGGGGGGGHYGGGGGGSGGYWGNGYAASGKTGSSGSIGQGGSGGNCTYTSGRSGWYSYAAGGGGGGSGYVGGVINGQIMGGNALMPDPSGGNMTGRTGDGYARITALHIAPIISLSPDDIKQYWELIPDKLPNGKVNPIWGCDHEPNIHICDSKCKEVKVLDCTEPHHKGLHYDGSNPICWEACNDNNNHRNFKEEINIADGSFVAGRFINLDYGFKIYFPNRGDFYGGAFHGIGSLSSLRGLNFRSNMDTTKWTRVKRIRFEYNVIYKDKLYKSGEWITLGDRGVYMGEAGEPYDDKLWSNYGTSLYADISKSYYDFYCVLSNEEAKSASINVEVEAVNCPGPNDNKFQRTNKSRGKFTALHGGRNRTYSDVVGRIGNLIIEDTGDYRFSNLFKLPLKNGVGSPENSDKRWIIDGVVREVDESKQNYFMTWVEDIRGVAISGSTNCVSTYYTLEWASDVGKRVRVPISSDKNNINVLKNERLLIGYPIYFSINTIGNYWRNESSEIQVVPYYYALDLNNKQLIPVDAYFKNDDEYQPVNIHDLVKPSWNGSGIYKFAITLDWLAEHQRRNYMGVEEMQTEKLRDFYDAERYEADNEVDEELKNIGDGYTEIQKQLYTPLGSNYILGNAQLLRANGRARTFIGGEVNYDGLKNLGGANNIRKDAYDRRYNAGGRLEDHTWWEACQRWHLKIGLPSSSVFIRSGMEPTSEAIKEFDSDDFVILCTADIRALGDTYVLEYKHYKDNGSVNVQKTDGSWTGHIVLPNNIPPVLAVYSSSRTSKYDVDIIGSH